MAEPCVSGTAFAISRRDVMALVESGRLARAQLAERLPPADLELLDEVPSPDSWYPLGSYERLLRLLLEIEGGGDPEYLVARGRRGMEAVLEGGVEERLRRADAIAGRHAPGPAAGWFERLGHALVTLPSAIFSEGRWKLTKGEGARLFTLEGEGLGHFPMNVARIVEGAVACLASRLSEGPVAVSTQQPGEGRILFVGASASGATAPAR